MKSVIDGLLTFRDMITLFLRFIAGLIMDYWEEGKNVERWHTSYMHLHLRKNVN